MAGAHAVAAWMNACEEAELIWMAELVVLWNTGKPRARNFGSISTHVLWFAVPGARHTWNSKRRAIYSNVLVCSKVHGKDKLHPAQKPVELTTFLVSLLTNEDDTVLDPFCGSGSTLVSAAVAGRDYIGFDRDKEYVKIAQRRAAQHEVEEEGELSLWINNRLEEI
jgi:DNA modification methylase